MRLDAYKRLEQTITDPNLTVDLNKDQSLTRLLDSAVIYMEGGTERDLTALDMDESELNSPEKSGGTETAGSKPPKKAKRAKKRKKSDASGSSRESTPNKKVVFKFELITVCVNPFVLLHQKDSDDSSSSSSSSEDSDSEAEGEQKSTKKSHKGINLPCRIFPTPMFYEYLTNILFQTKVAKKEK